MWRRRLRRLLVGLLVIAVVATAAFVVVKPFRVSLLTVALVPELLNQGPRPLSALTPDPRRESIQYGSAVRDRMDLYLPGTSPADLATPPRYPAVMLVLGVNPLPLDDERVIRTATAIARLGVVVAAPESDELRNWRLDPSEAPHLVEAFEAVAARPEVDPDRIGMAAFSVGAAIAMIAAADPRIADRVQWINAFGGFGDAETLLVESATRRMVVSGQERPWKMGNLARQMFLRTVVRLASTEADGERIRGMVEAPILGDGASLHLVRSSLRGVAHARLARGLPPGDRRRPRHRRRRRGLPLTGEARRPARDLAEPRRRRPSGARLPHARRGRHGDPVLAVRAPRARDPAGPDPAGDTVQLLRPRAARGAPGSRRTRRDRSSSRRTSTTCSTPPSDAASGANGPA